MGPVCGTDEVPNEYEHCQVKDPNALNTLETHTFPSLWRWWQCVRKMLTGKLLTATSPSFFFLDIYSLVYFPTETHTHREIS